MLRLQRVNAQVRARTDQMKADLADKRRLKKEIEDWLEEKVTVEF